MNTAPMGQDIYTAVSDVLRLRTGLTFPDARAGDVRREIDRAARAANMSGIAAYYSALQGNSGLIDALAERLTVKESYFFRHPAQLEFMVQTVFPELAGAPGLRDRRIWSAGCAGGEEAYTVALLAATHLPAARILGTDISSQALEKARRGVYSAWALRTLTPRQIDRYFIREEGRWRLRKHLAAGVVFERLNLVDDVYPSAFPDTYDVDLILCRNVLIYFDADTVQDVIRRLVRCLRPGGWLILGPSDPPVDANADLETVLTPDGVYYRRRQAEAAAIVVEALETAPAHIDAEPQEPEPAVKEEPELAEGLPAVQSAFAREAWDDVDRMARHLPDDVTACALRIRALSNGAREDEAFQAADTAVAAHPLSSELHVLAALLHLGRRREGESERLLRRAIYLDPSMAVAHFLLGLVLERRGKTAASCTSYRNAIRSAETLPAGQVLPLANGELPLHLAAAARQRLDALGDPRTSA